MSKKFSLDSSDIYGISKKWLTNTPKIFWQIVIADNHYEISISLSRDTPQHLCQIFSFIGWKKKNIF